MSGARVRRAAAAGAAIAVLLAGCSSGPTPPEGKPPPTVTTTPAPPASATPSVPSASTAPAASGLCGYMAPAQAHYSHVIWIWMENHSYGSVIGSRSAPYANQVASECGLATDYHNVTHPSLPNYIAATSGLSLAQLGPYTGDCDPSPSCSAGAGVGSIFSQAPTWKAYAESMPVPCDKVSSDDYAARHNPAVYYRSLAADCGSDDVDYTALGQDLGAGRLPAFSFVTPNLVDDTHNGSVADGDKWLRTALGAITSSPAYRSGTVAVFVVWDEGEGGSASNCAANTVDVGCRVPALVLSASTRPGTSSGALFSHYSLLRTAEDLLGLPPLGEASGAPSMAGAFGLSGAIPAGG